MEKKQPDIYKLCLHVLCVQQQKPLVNFCRVKLHKYHFYSLHLILCSCFVSKDIHSFICLASTDKGS